MDIQIERENIDGDYEVIYELKVEILSPTVTSVSPTSAKIGETVTFTALGKNLPLKDYHDLGFHLDFCDGITTISGTSEEWKFSCKLLDSPGNQAGRIISSIGSATLFEFNVNFSKDGGSSNVSTPTAPINNSNSKLINISTRSIIKTGQDSAIAGFIINGSVKQKVLVKALGKSLQNSGLDTELDPRIDLYKMDASGSTLIYSNDNWQDDVNFAEIPEPMRPIDITEAAMLRELEPGTYTAIVSAVSDINGIGLVSVDTINNNDAVEVINISTRAVVGNGDESEIPGFIISGTDKKTVLIMALGKSLQNAGVETELDPKIQLYKMDASGSTLIATNDNWQDDDNSSKIPEHMRPKDDSEAAMLRELEAGTYTAVVTSVSGINNVGLVSVDVIQ
jgi:hypothetical protein